jgi:outer membrane receptor protein involved in Fe transport
MITVDGADFVNASSGVQRATPPQESVQEFRVVNNSFGSEYGRAVGGIVNIVTKGGTNILHGSVYDYLQNNKADSRSLLQPAPLPYELRQNQFGGTLGGPIRKDKTFFFVNYEARRRAESPTYPPDLLNHLDLIDAAKAQLGLAPEGCSTGLSSCTGSNIGYLNSFLKTGDDDAGFVRLDHAIGDKNRLAVRYAVQDVRSLGELVGATLDGGGIGAPSGGRNLYVRDQSVFGTLDTTITNNLINTALVQYARRHYGFLGATGQPDLSILNDLELGHNFGTQDRTAESRVEFSDSLSWVKGKHVMKFGFDGNVIKSLFNFPGFTPTRALLPTGAGPADCLAAFAEFYKYGANWQTTAAPGPLLTASATCPVAAVSGPDALNGVVAAYAGVPLPTDPTFTGGPPLVTGANPLDTSTWANAYPQSISENYSVKINHGYWGLFVQDQWRITRKLTLNAGVRWDYESGLASFVTQDYNNWQPRVGLAYSPNSKTVIRAGFGLFDDRYNLTFFYVPNSQKEAPGYLCANNASSAITAACTAKGIQPQKLPMGRPEQANQGYQLFVFPGAAGAADLVKSVIQTGGYGAFPPINPVQMAGACAATFQCGVGEGGMDHNVSKTPYAEQASLEIDRQIGKGLAINLGYLFVEAHRLVRGNNINVPCPLGTTDAKQAANPTDPNLWPLAPAFLGFKDWVPGKLNADGTFSTCSDGTAGNPSGAPILGTGALAGLGPWFAGAGPNSGLQNMSAGLLDYNNGVANAVYHGGTLTVIERTNNFNLTVNYTYSHTIDNGNFTTFINLPVNQFDYKAERANSNQDGRHRLVANFSATAPDSSFLRHFGFSSIITAQSGRPFTIFYGGNTLNDLAGGNTDRVGGAPIASNCPSASDCATMIPRNTYVGDPLYSWDLRLSRYFQVREKLRLDLSVDAFNALNRKNVDEVNPVYGSPVFCGTTPVVPLHYNDAVSRAIQQQDASTVCPVGPVVVPGGSIAPTPIPGGSLFIPAKPNATFGTPRTMLNPRQLQFGLKFSF